MFEFKWLFIFLAVAAMSWGAVKISDNISGGAVARASAVKACVDHSFLSGSKTKLPNMAECARLK